LVGYIEVGNTLEPVITRDEFVKSNMRNTVYRLISKNIEPTLKEKIDNKNMVNYDEVMQSVESVVSRCLIAALRAKPPTATRKLPFETPQPVAAEAESSSDSDSSSSSDSEAEPAKPDDPIPEPAKPEEPPKPKDPPPPPFTIQFVKILTDDKGEMLRSVMVGKFIQVNMNHPDFVSRTKFTRQGHPTFGDRLCSYLACVVSSAYVAKHGDHAPVTQVVDQLVGTISAMEGKLRKRLGQHVKADEEEQGPEDQK